MYGTGTLLGDTKIAQNLCMALDGPLQNVGWTKVGTNVVSNTFTHNIYQVPAGNEKALTFYLDLGWDSGNSNTVICISCFGGWNASTNTPSLYAPAVQNPAAPLANLFYGASTTGNASGNTLFANTQAQTNMGSAIQPIQGLHMNYYYSITQDRVVFAWGPARAILGLSTTTGVGGTLAGAFYIGLFDSLMDPTVDSFPVTCCNVSGGLVNASLGSNGVNGFTLTETMQAAFVEATASFWQAGMATRPFIGDYPVPTITAGQQSINGHQRFAYPMRAAITSPLVSAGVNYGLRGLFKDLIVIRQYGMAISQTGDQVQFYLNGQLVTLTQLSYSASTTALSAYDNLPIFMPQR